MVQDLDAFLPGHLHHLVTIDSDEAVLVDPFYPLVEQQGLDDICASSVGTGIGCHCIHVGKFADQVQERSRGEQAVVAVEVLEEELGQAEGLEAL